MTTLREAAQQALEALEAFMQDDLRPYDAQKAITALRAAMAQQAEINVPVPNGLAQSDAEFWLRHRADIIEACRAHGLTIVTTAHGAHLMQLGKIEAQQADPAPGWCKHCKQYSIEEPLPAQQEPDLRGANPIGLTPPQKDLQRAQFRADALAQRAEPSRTQRMRDAGYTRRPTAREMVEKDEPVRELLISAAAMAVVAERKGEYKGASWVADAILETVPFSSQASQQAEPTQAPCDIAEDGVCEVIDCCRNPKQAEPVAWVLPDLLPVFSFKTAQLWKRPFAEDQIPLYTAPPQRKPLTEEEIYEMYSEPSSDAEMVEFARAIERAHGIGGDDEQA